MTLEFRYKFAVDGAPQAAQAFETVGQAAQRMGVVVNSTSLAQASRGMDALGVSVRQTAAAMRTLPAQLTDVFTQLAGGQNPLLVLIQQGGQVKDSFGGMGNAIRAIGSLLTPTRVALLGVGGALGILLTAAKGGSDEMAKLRRTLEITGNAAGLTADRFDAMARAVQAASGNSIGSARDTLLQLAASGRLSGDALREAAVAAERLSLATGEDAGGIGKRFVSMLDDVARGAANLNKQYNFLTLEQFKQIQKLEQQGKAQEAVALTFELLNKRVPEQTKNLGTLERAWHGFSLVLSDVWDKLKGIGRVTTLQEIEKRQREINMILTANNYREPSEGNTSAMRIKQLREQLAGLRALAAEQDKAAERSAKQAAKTQDDIDDLLKANKNLGEAYRSLMGDLRQLAMTQEEEAAAGGKITAARQLQIQLYDKLASAADKLSLAERLRVKDAIEGIVRQAQEEAEFAAFKAQLDDQALARGRSALQFAKERAEGEQEITDWMNAQLAPREQAIKGVEASIEALQDEMKAAALAKTGHISLAEALERVTIARLRDSRAALVNNPEALKLLDEEIAKREALAKIIGSNETLKANERAAEAAAQAWERTADQIGQSLTDALMQGGRSAWEYIKGMVRAQVLRPIVEMTAAPFARALAGINPLQVAGYTQSFASNGSMFGSLFSGANAYGLEQVLAPGGGIGGGILGGLGTIGGGISNALAGFASSGVGQALGLGTTAVDALGYAYAAPSAAGSALAAAGPYAMAAAVLYSLAKSLDKSGTPHLGSVVTADLQGVRTGGDDPGGVLRNLNTETDTALKLIAGSSVQLLNSLSRTFGSTAAFSAQAKFTADGVDNTFAGFQVYRDGERLAQIAGTINNDAKNTYTSDRTKAFEQYSLDVAATVRQALDAIELPQWAREQLAALGDSADLDKIKATADSITSLQAGFDALQDALQPMGGTFGVIAQLSSDAVASLAGFSGGLSGLQTNLDTFYREFFSEQERAGMEQAKLAATLAEVGLAVPSTRDAFRQLVESQDLTTEAGRRSYAALLGVSGAFAALNPLMQDAAAGSATLADALARQAEIDRERTGLEGQLLRLQGNTGELRRRELAALDVSNRSLQEQIYAYEDAAAVAQAAAAAQQALATATAAGAEANARALDAITAAQQRYLVSQGDVRGALQSLADFGAGLRAELTGAEAALDDLRLRASAALEAAGQRASAAFDSIAEAAEQAATRVDRAAADLKAALAQRSSLAGAINDFIQRQREVADQARGGVLSALSSLVGRADDAARALAQAGDTLRNALAGRVTAATSIAGLLEQQRNGVAGARGGVLSALSGLRGSADAAAALQATAQQRITEAFIAAQGDYQQAMERLASLQGKTADTTEELARRMGSLRDGIGDFLLELTGSVQDLRRAPAVGRSQFLQVADAAGRGDAQAAGQLLGVARQFLEASRGGSSTAAQYDADVRLVRQVLGQVQGRAASAAVTSGGMSDAEAIVQAQAEVARALAQVESLRAAAAESGAALTATSVDLLAEWRQSQAAAAAALTAYNTAAEQARSVGIAEQASVGEVAAALAQFQSLQATYQAMVDRTAAAGVDLGLADQRDALARLLDEYGAAEAAIASATGAQELAAARSQVAATELAAATVQAAAFGLALPTAEADAFGAALAGLTTAQTTLATTIERVNAAGVDLGLRDTRDELQRLLDEFGLSAAAVLQAEAQQTAAVLASAAAAQTLRQAVDEASAAGLAFGAASVNLLGEFTGALDDLTGARALVEALGQATPPATLADEWRQLQDRLSGARSALEEFERRTQAMDFSGLAILDPLGTLLQRYSDAVNGMLEAQQALANLQDTGRFVDIGGGFQRYLSTGGAAAIQQDGVTGLTLIGKDGRVFAESALKAWVADQFGAGALDAIYREAVAFGISSSDLQKLTGTGDTVLAWAQAMGLPAFANGGTFGRGGLALVGELGPEVVALPPMSRVFDADSSRGLLGGDLAAEVQALRAEVARFREQSLAIGSAEVEQLSGISRQVRRWDGDGVPVRNAEGTTLETTP